MTEASDPNPLGKVAAYGDLLASAPEHERSSRDPSDARDAGSLAHAEAQRLDAGVIVSYLDDLEILPRAGAIERVVLA